jgi:hypothetical protein
MDTIRMTVSAITALVTVYGLALWLGLYLIGRDPRSPRLLLTGTGLLAYAFAVACNLLADAASPELAVALARVGWPLLLLPALCWTGALIQLLPDEVVFRERLSRAWNRFVLPLTVLLLLLVSFGTDLVVGRSEQLARGVAQTVLGNAVLAPMLALGYLVWRSRRRRRPREVTGLLVVFTLFFGLSTALILFPLGWFPSLWTMLSMGVDLIGLGLAIAYFDAFDQGEALLPDTIRSLDAAALSALVFGGQVALVMALATGPTLPMLLLLLGTVASAIAATTLADPLGAALDRVALGRLPRVREARSELRATASALPRANPELDPSKLDEEDFTRLTRRALSSFGDLPRLSASPLVNLPLIERRLAARNAPDDPLERAAELKALLAESIARLKPRTDAAFGTSDEWRYYNALHFPYVVGLKPYSARNKTKPAEPATREALEWFRARVPERTLYNWQNAAARLVASDLLARNESSSR